MLADSFQFQKPTIAKPETVSTHFMTSILQHIITFSLTAFLLPNIYGQTIKPVNQDSTLQQQISTYRLTFWDSLPKQNGRINDYEGLYEKEEELALDSLIRIFKSETGIEIVILTLDTINSDKDNFDQLTLRIANHWAVGEKGKYNGILIGISRGHRKIRINNGAGIVELISDAETKAIIYNYFIPYFKTEQYYDGTFTGLTELIKHLKRKLK